MEISKKMHLSELSTVIHVDRKQIKCIPVNKRPRDRWISTGARVLLSVFSQG